MEDIQGEEGNFRVKVHSEPRFVDIDKCTGCGDCTLITLDEEHPPREHQGWLWVDRISIDEAKCTHCGECIAVCRKENPELPAMSSVVHHRLEAFPAEEEEPEHSLQKVLRLRPEEREDFWREAFATCIKCYGCLDVCPVHIEEPEELRLASFVPKGEVPPKHPDFHLLRAYQVYDTCVLCAECELTCPADIPLKTLQDLVRYLPPDKVFELVPGAEEETKQAILGFVDRIQSQTGSVRA